MGMMFDFFAQRIYGTPNSDGYGSQTLTLEGGETSARQLVNLGRNTVYQIINDAYQNNDASVFFKVLSRWNSTVDSFGDTCADEAHNLDEALVEDDTGVTLLSGNSVFITTNTFRHVLSIKIGDGSTQIAVVKVIKMEAGKTIDENGG